MDIKPLEEFPSALGHLIFASVPFLEKMRDHLLQNTPFQTKEGFYTYPLNNLRGSSSLSYPLQPMYV
jgi:hypothetical protein